jgi:hypothetical protein
MSDGTQIFGRISKPKLEQIEGTCSIGQLAKQFLGEQVSPKQSVYAEVIDVWNEMLPAELAEHCRITDITAGQITVAVDSPSYRYELNLCSPELLKELQTQCPGSRLKKIRFSLLNEQR